MWTEKKYQIFENLLQLELNMLVYTPFYDLANAHLLYLVFFYIF